MPTKRRMIGSRAVVVCGTGVRWGGVAREKDGGHKENSEGDRFVHYLGCEDGFMGAHVCQTYQVVHLEYLQFTAY